MPFEPRGTAGRSIRPRYFDATPLASRLRRATHCLQTGTDPSFPPSTARHGAGGLSS